MISASFAVEESLTMRYDTSNLSHAKDTLNITDRTSEQVRPDNYIDYIPKSQSPDSHMLNRRPHEKLTVKDVVFGERMTLTPPVEPKQSVLQTAGQSNSPRGKIIVNPYIVNHSYSITPNTNFQISEKGEVKIADGNQTFAISDKDKVKHSKSSGIKSLQKMSDLQQCTARGQKKSIQVTNARTNKMRTADFEKSLLNFFENSQSGEHNTEEMLHTMQQILDNSYTQRSTQLNPSPPRESPKDRFDNNQSTTIRTVQKTAEKSTSSTMQHHVVTKSIASQNRPYQQIFYPEKQLIHRDIANIHHPVVNQKSLSQKTATQHTVTQKQSISEQSVTHNLLGKSSGQTVTVTESSQVCTEVKSAVQTTTGTKTKKATSMVLRPHQ